MECKNRIPTLERSVTRLRTKGLGGRQSPNARSSNSDLHWKSGAYSFMRNPMDTLGPASETLRLTENYRQMSDDELIDLARHRSELTDMAQGILSQEISSRKLKVPPADQRSPERFAAPENAQDAESLR